MKFIKVPELAISTEGMEPTNFKEFLCAVVLNDEVFGSGYQALKAATHIETAVECSNGVLEIHEADYKYLRAAIENPKPGYNPRVARQLLPFLDAIANAQDAKPE